MKKKVLNVDEVISKKVTTSGFFDLSQEDAKDVNIDSSSSSSSSSLSSSCRVHKVSNSRKKRPLSKSNEAPFIVEIIDETSEEDDDDDFVPIQKSKRSSTRLRKSRLSQFEDEEEDDDDEVPVQKSKRSRKGSHRRLRRLNQNVDDKEDEEERFFIPENDRLIFLEGDKNDKITEEEGEEEEEEGGGEGGVGGGEVSSVGGKDVDGESMMAASNTSSAS